jgi:hypothetical protein
MLVSLPFSRREDLVCGVPRKRRSEGYSRSLHSSGYPPAFLNQLRSRTSDGRAKPHTPKASFPQLFPALRTHQTSFHLNDSQISLVDPLIVFFGTLFHSLACIIHGSTGDHQAIACSIDVGFFQTAIGGLHTSSVIIPSLPSFPGLLDSTCIGAPLNWY